MFPYRSQRSIEWNSSRRYFVFCRVIVGFDCGDNRSTISLLALCPSELGDLAARVLFQLDSRLSMLIKGFRREPLGTLRFCLSKRLLELAKWMQIPGYEVAQNLLQGRSPQILWR